MLYTFFYLIKKYRTFFLALILFLIPSTSLASTGVYKTVLPNGLKVLIQENHALPIITTLILYKVGSRNEASGRSGKVHFIEHMMFKGTDKYRKGEIDKIVKRAGGYLEAYTAEDYTEFYFNLPSEHLRVALEIEADRMRNCKFDPLEFETERRVIMEERRMDLDSPYVVFEEEIIKRAFSVHPYRCLILGCLKNIESFTREEIISFYNTYYQPNNAILVVVGDVQTERVLELIKETLGRIPKGPDPPPVTVVEPEQKEERSFKIKRDVSFPMIEIVFHAPPVDTKDSYALSVLDNILTYGESSRLYKKLVKDLSLFNEVGSAYHERKDPYIFTIAAELKGGVDRQAAGKALLKEIENLKKNPPSEYEIEKAKNQIEADFIFGQESIKDQAEILTEAEFLYGYEQLQRYVQEIRAVTKEDIQKVAQKYFVKENRTIGWLLPESE